MDHQKVTRLKLGIKACDEQIEDYESRLKELRRDREVMMKDLVKEYENQAPIQEV